MMRILVVFLFLSFTCKSRLERVDYIIYNAVIYTVDSKFSVHEVLVVKDGKIVATGDKSLMDKYVTDSLFDAAGHAIFPGFIDAHAHLKGYGQSLSRVDLVGTNSWQEVVDKTIAFGKINPGGWVLGRGWDQNDWAVKQFPDKDALDAAFPDRPVLLTRVDGHAAIANSAALRLAGITSSTKLTGGDVILKNGQPTGVLIDNAIGLVSMKIPNATIAEQSRQFILAAKNCFAVGLTTVVDCGLGYRDVELLDSIQKSGDFLLRMYVMLSDNKKNYEYLFSNGIIKTDRLHVRSFKLYGDGALGSRGACLLQPYADQPGHYGFLLSNAAHFDSVASLLAAKKFQMCTHAIGDSANRILLNIYGKYLKGKNDLRWRIEHAQVVNQNDFELFGKYSIIPSVQPTHATSDMYWAGDRLGPERVKGAYAFKQLMQQNGWIPLGTDFPVEDISPFKTFFASVIRKDDKGFPSNGFQSENKLSREETIRGMTIWAARANFEENEKGSLEKGKWADYIMLDRDLMKIPENEILQTKVLTTVIGGKIVYNGHN